MTKLITAQFSQSTADDARDYFSGATQAVVQPAPSVLPEGTYRVVDGVLCRIVEGVPPELAERLRSEGEPQSRR